MCAQRWNILIFIHTILKNTMYMIPLRRKKKSGIELILQAFLNSYASLQGTVIMPLLVFHL